MSTAASSPDTNQLNKDNQQLQPQNIAIQKTESAHQRARRLADSDSDESLTMELDPKLLLLPIVRLNRIETVDTSVIIEERTKTKENKSVTEQLGTRNRKQVARDDRVMRFVGDPRWNPT